MKLLLIDGNSVLFRGFYATFYTNLMKTSKGVYTNAVYAFANMLNKALNTIKPDYIAVAFDKGKKTFRHQMVDDYKGGRKETPEELVNQFALVREMLEAYNIRYLEYDEIEADDVIGTLAKKYPIETCILSSDHDLFQLIDDTTYMYVMKKGMSDIQMLNASLLKEEYGFTPEQLVDYKGLAGDKSDNIKGVDGIGDKTAIKLLNEYGNVENLYDHIDEIKGKMKEKLLAGKESCFLSKTLATIKTDFDIPLDLEDYRLNINEKTMNEFFEKYEMRSLIKGSVSSYEKKEEIQAKNVTKISESLFNNPFIYFDSNEFSYFNRELFGLCFANENECEYISLEDFIKDKDALNFLASDNKKTVYDLKAILHMLDNYKLTIGYNTDDLMLMTFLSNNSNNDIKKIVQYYNLDELPELKDIYGTDKKPAELSLEQHVYYSSLFARNFYKIINIANKEIIDKELSDLYNNLELPVVRVLYSMEKEGIYCDENALDVIANNCLDKINSLMSSIYEHVGHEFNINSPKQLKEVLYDELELPNLKKGSTNADVLSKLVNYHPVINEILEYRKFSKLYSTYAEGLKKYIDEDGKIHTIFSQTITATGRLSSYDPNLQNISVKDDDGKEIRKAFNAGEGHTLISCDYSQIELRVLASLAGEEKMIDAFNNGIDIHTKTAMDVFKVDENDVTPLIRRHAKAVNFGVVYGISDFGLANQTSLSFKDAKRFIDDYFITYPKIKTYLDSQVEFCDKNGYVKTMMNRRRYINEIHDRNFMMREFGRRAAMNSTIQGSAADLIKVAMINVYNELIKNNMKSKMILQVHDELIFNVPDDEIDEMVKLITESMSNAYKLPVKLDVSLSMGKTWYEAK